MSGRLQALRDAYVRLIARVHSFRLPIRTRAGRAGMGMMYVSIPCVLGWLSLQAVIAARNTNLGTAGSVNGDRPLLRAASVRSGAPSAVQPLRLRRRSPACAATEVPAPR